MQKPVLQPADILLPAKGENLGLWAVLACDQFTSQPEYWQQVEELVGTAPSTLHIIYPEVYLEEENGAARIAKIQASMRQYRQQVLTQKVQGYVYVERTFPGLPPRQGLVGCVDLEDYSYTPGAASRIRPSENTLVERIPPRLAVRRGAALESPHILMLADDTEKAIIEPFAHKKDELELLYSQDLILDGGHVQGWAITSPQDIAQIAAALATLDNPERFAEKYDAQGQPHFALAVGDGNHSLATAKAYWEELKQTLPAAEAEDHPARYCLVELENVQSPAIEIEPIHRVVFGADPACMLRGAALFAGATGGALLPAGQDQQQFVALHKNGQQGIGVSNPHGAIAAATLDAFLQGYAVDHPEIVVDYVHGEDAVRELAQKGAVGILLPPFQKSDLFKGVALGGVLPKKTFSMGHANQKRYYLECRAIER
ncbi:DUF1015 domain-containing protein [Ruminococcaceae bacterium OttesenSCG-928-A16]|nr:DUF1015 domain-containing protein [Ruminococcaceae bacterium OttesenSCG-928-A16]